MHLGSIGCRHSPPVRQEPEQKMTKLRREPTKAELEKAGSRDPALQSAVGVKREAEGCGERP